MARQPALALARPRSVPALSGPWRRAVLIGACVVALLGLLYLGARETPVFALRTVEVEGAPATVRQAILQSLEETRGTSLVSLDGDAVVRRLEALPSVQSVTYDRAFPHTLRLVVVPEKPVAVVNQASNLWIVSVRGRVIGGTSAAEAPYLPRIRYLARGAAHCRRVRGGRGDEDDPRGTLRGSEAHAAPDPLGAPRRRRADARPRRRGGGASVAAPGRARRRGDEIARCGTCLCGSSATRNGTLSRISTSRCPIDRSLPPTL